MAQQHQITQLQQLLSQEKSTNAALRTHIRLYRAGALAHEAERREWELEREAWRRDLMDENKMLEAVLQKYNISLTDAHAAVAAPLKNDPSYTEFLKIATRGRRPSPAPIYPRTQPADPYAEN